MEGKMRGTKGPKNISTKRSRIAKLAKERREPLTTLAHHIDIDWMLEAYRRTRKRAAPGVDGQNAEQYAVNSRSNLESLLDRAKSGHRYRAPPVRRVYIPKGDGGRRPIGIPTFEDKVLQRAVAMVLEPIYEQEFLDCSYGFRPGRNAHQALDTLWRGLMDLGGGWVLELDIRSFFDAMDHGVLRRILRERVNDGVLLRLIGKWLNAGVLEQGCVYHPETGTPQGGVISPLLANVYLHEVLDLWFEDVVKPRLRGRAFMVRYADDATLVFAREDDARRVMNVLGKRFAKYGLTLHPEKTRLVPFRRPSPRDAGKRGSRPGTFDVLGFTHYWGRSRKGTWVVKRRTAKSRLSRALRSISRWMSAHRHDPVWLQHKSLSAKLRGHYGYYGITGNARALSRFRSRVVALWWRWLGRRNSRRLTWERYARILERLPLPEAIAVHSVLRSANP
jgi:group II intron reverse transcriptase/maturase